MSSTLRLSIIMVLLLATTALGLIAYNNMTPPKPVVQVTGNTPAPPTTRYFVAAHPLPAGTLAREEDFTVRSVSPIAFHQGRSLIRPRLGLVFAVLWFARSSTLAVSSHHRTYCAREIGVSLPASWHRVPVPSASTWTRSLAFRA